MAHSPDCAATFTSERHASAAIPWQLSGPHRVFGEAVEAAVPAPLMPVTLSDGLEDRLVEGHLRLALVLGEGDRHQGFMAAAAVLAIPGEGIDQALGLHDFAKDAALPKLATAVVRAQ